MAPVTPFFIEEVNEKKRRRNGDGVYYVNKSRYVSVLALITFTLYDFTPCLSPLFYGGSFNKSPLQKFARFIFDLA